MDTMQEVQNTYQRMASRYDAALKFYRLLGFRFDAYRARGVELLRLRRGDTVVDLGCGTGLNFPHLIERIGPEGRLIGVDLTPEMLAHARERARRAGWGNVELVRSDIAAYDIPEGVNAVLATGVLGFVAEYDRVIEAAARALAPGGRLVIVDGKRPEGWPAWLFRLFVELFRPYGCTLEYFATHPWEAVERHFEEAAFEEMYAGLVYISAGAAPSPAA